jgi:hypothetical protein
LEITLSLYSIAFYCGLFFTLFGALLGLIGVWFHDFWKSDTTVKLLITDLILAGTSIVVAAMTKWLG